MPIQSEELITAINQLIFEWQKTGLIIDSRNHQAYQKSNGLVEVTWGNDGYVLKENDFSTLSEYCSLVESRQYSMLLADGSFFQISYGLRRREIVRHRLCWYPSPVKFSEELMDSGGIIDEVLERMAKGDTSFFQSRSPLRFDYSPDDASEMHPEVHLHIGHEDCRIPVKSALSLRSFMVFVVENFYADISAGSRLHRDALNWFCGDKLTHDQRQRVHINGV
ncbi:DUF2290 domain-containing protein [Pseudomonas veronii]